MSNMTTEKTSICDVCYLCNKKLKLLDKSIGACKCGQYFCQKHFDSTVHQCTYNYHFAFKKQLESGLKSIEPVKVSKI